jgi:CheY-like chemotaxis protein
VDDDPAVQELLAGLLRGPHRAVEVRDTAQAALDFLQHNSVDLAFVDQALPGTAGAKLAEKIQAQCPHAHVLTCTGHLVESNPAGARPNNGQRSLQKQKHLGELLQLADSYTAE